MRFLPLIIIFLVPNMAQAQVVISEIMYDLEGSDADREWVEIHNLGAAEVDLAGWKFFDKNGGHKLPTTGTAPTLAPGAVAVIVDSVEKFKIDWPAFSGTLIDSSFDLVNTTDTIGLYDKDGKTIDSIIYDTNFGAAGDGNSLSRSGNTFIAHSPTPGQSNSSSGSSVSSASSSSTSVSSSSSSSNTSTAPLAPFEPVITAYAGLDREGTPGVTLTFVGEARGLKGDPLPYARYLWIFGDGSTAEGRRVGHTYHHPGTYAAVLEVSSGEHNASDRAIVKINEARISISTRSGVVLIKNLTNADVDLSEWSLSAHGSLFRIPAGTILLTNTETPFSDAITGFSMFPGTNAILNYPNGTPAARTTSSVVRVASSSSAIRAVAFTESAVHTSSSTALSAALQAAVGESAPSSSVSWYGALAGVMIVGGGAAWFVRRTGKTSRVADEFEIIEG